MWIWMLGAALAQGPSYVLVGAEVPLRTAARGDATAAQPLPGEGFRALRWVEEQGDWIVVENLPDLEHYAHCYPSDWRLAAFRLQLYVPREALVPVTQQPVTVELRDGTRASLTAGVAVTDGRTRVDLPAWGFALRVPQKSVGTRYERPGLFDMPDPTSSIDPDAFASGRVTLGDQPVHLGRARAVHFAYDPVAQGDRSTVVLRAPCAEIRVALPTADIHPANVSGVLEGRGRPTGGWHVDPGTVVYWADGRPAGSVVQQWRLQAHDEREERICDRVAGLDLCFRSDDVRRDR